MDRFEWQPKRHEVIKDAALADTIHDTGYAIPGNIGADAINRLKELYAQLHDFKAADGGMFYSLYSNDLRYRSKVHEGIWEIMKPIYDQYFNDYKTVINSFIVKLQGSESEFTLHQDSTGMDELQYSPLSLWIPLQDTNIDNGCLSVVPKSHGMFYPYRGISFESPFSKIESEVRKYLVPIEMKAGDILMFDNRLVHYSPPNVTTEPRIIVMSGVFPSQAVMQVCYKDETKADSLLEIYEQTDDYLITNTTFYHNCTCQPERGVKVKELDVKLPAFTKEDFKQAATQAGLQEVNHPGLLNEVLHMQIISEPA